MIQDNKVEDIPQGESGLGIGISANQNPQYVYVIQKTIEDDPENSHKEIVGVSLSLEEAKEKRHRAIVAHAQSIIDAAINLYPESSGIFYAVDFRILRFNTESDEMNFED